MAAVGLRLGQQLQRSTFLFPGSILGAPAPSTSRTSCASQSVRALKKQSHSSSPKGSGGKGSIAEKSKVESGSRGGGGSHPSRKKLDSGSSLKLDESIIASLPMPKPPAGFILDEAGRVVLVAPAANRVVTIVDPATQRPLECMIRRAFRSSQGQDCLLLLPLDMPLQILKIEEESEGLRELSDDELQAVLPTAAYALAKRRLHLIISGFCLTARGGFCYTEEHVLDLNTDNGEGLGGSLAEGVEIANFQLNDDEYLIYTPFDPLMFVAKRDEVTGELKIADDELLDDEVVLDAIDEENEFQALVDEEDAINETLREAK
ncbi:hypothetical protein MPTK1_3g20510 [Marchantia polymorpha subsp. ruderalis]|uniref:Uncharacterized protein n=2 Tax=Marchantia polymorpha TaxID=3197 RepID=A0AAF6B2Y0_MARPO|nr:hypothetical protein MARPO_0149s0016 [Marchantia polymorpha]BBN06364.1 hypothetical protein Mp_3g20510 [Marchantia polymorpha subsp. ruderalis]|eukprot:PTQ29019.1 hypothetical protein MARPO_0149s0016 [Marchantia polymorpha]